MYVERTTDDTLIADSDDDSDDLSDHHTKVQKPFRTTEELRSSQKEFESVLYEDDQMLQPHPQFWLFLKISEESVNIYLHHRLVITFEIIKFRLLCVSLNSVRILYF